MSLTANYSEDNMKKLNVLGQKVRVKIQKIPDELSADGQSFDDCIIIDPRCSDPFQVYCHELMHQILDRLGIYRTEVNKDVEHIIVDAVATVISENIVTLYQAHNKLKKLK